MNCEIFYNWLEERDIHDVSETDQALKHAEKCADCRVLFQKDEQLNSVLFREMAPVSVPVRLKNRIDLNLEQHGILQKTTSWWTKFIPLALAALLVIYFAFPFSAGFKTMDTMGQYVLADHLGHSDSKMVVHDIENLSNWCAGKVDFVVQKPDMPENYSFIGARICPLGDYNSVHLSYMTEGKRVSLYIMDEEEASLSLRNGKKYSITTDGHTIRFWKESNKVYALIT